MSLTIGWPISGALPGGRGERVGAHRGHDKLTMLSPTEAWFEGLRVHNDFRRRGLASSLQKYMIGEAARLGAQAIRLTTVATNQPVHLACYRDGFSLKCVLRFWKWEEGRGRNCHGRSMPAYKLRYATPQEASTLYEQWKRSASFRTAGLAHIAGRSPRPQPRNGKPPLPSVAS